MSRILSILFVLSIFFPAASRAESIIDRIASSGNIRVYQPETLYRLIKPTAVADSLASVYGATNADGSDEAATTRSGYRVLVFDDNNPRTARTQAESRHRQMQSEFPNLRAYVTFNSPYWRVKVGDFRTRGEAEAAMAELRHAFPALAAYMRIVRDKINIFD